jgi:hypothetical protein
MAISTVTMGPMSKQQKAVSREQRAESRESREQREQRAESRESRESNVTVPAMAISAMAMRPVSRRCPITCVWVWT